MPHAEEHHGRGFPSTHWSMVDRVRHSDVARARAALSDLLRLYLPALTTHLVVAKRFSVDQADDALQSFVADKILEQDLVSRADRDRGKFRTFLLSALDRFLVSRHRHDHARKRQRPTSAECDERMRELASAGAARVDRSFDIAWARQLLSETLRRMEAECRAGQRGDLWDVFEARVLGPTLRDAAPLPYERLVKRFGFKSPTQAANALITAKRMFKRILRSLVAEYADSPEAVDAELRDLWAILAAGGAGSA